MSHRDVSVRTPQSEPTHGQAGRQPPVAAAPRGPAEDAATGTPVTGQPDAATVSRGLRAVRRVLSDLAPRDDPIRRAVVPVDDLLLVLDEAIRLLEGRPPTGAAAGQAIGRTVPYL